MTYVIEVVVMCDDNDVAEKFCNHVDASLCSWVEAMFGAPIPFIVSEPIERVPVETVLQMIRDAEEE